MVRTAQFSVILMRIIEVENDYFKLFCLAFFKILCYEYLLNLAFTLFALYIV